MICKKPFIKGILVFGCAQCMPCRINRQRVWAHRIVLESYKHESNSFVTLTYDDKNLPLGGTLVPRDYQLFLKSLREFVYPNPIRFFAVGEYGDASERPHYHLGVFGHPGCLNWYQTDYERAVCNCDACFMIRKCWKKGRTDNAFLTKDSAQYLAKYVTKRLTNKNDPWTAHWLRGRYPEFSRQSNGGGKAMIKGGIGVTAIDEIVDALCTEHGIKSIVENRDVPVSLMLGKKQIPLGRYLRSKIREKIASEKGREIIKRENLERFAEEMRGLLADARGNSATSGSGKVFKSVREVMAERNKQKIRNIEARSKIGSRKL